MLGDLADGLTARDLGSFGQEALQRRLGPAALLQGLDAGILAGECEFAHVIGQALFE
ncbi:hypothetical protein D3C86_2222690 [compost metagenome]